VRSSPGWERLIELCDGEKIAGHQTDLFNRDWLRKRLSVKCPRCIAFGILCDPDSSVGCHGEPFYPQLRFVEHTGLVTNQARVCGVHNNIVGRDNVRCCKFLFVVQNRISIRSSTQFKAI